MTRGHTRPISPVCIASPQEALDLVQGLLRAVQSTTPIDHLETPVQAPGIPDSIPRTQMAAAMRTLGIDPTEVVAVSYGVEEVQITRYRLDADGRRIMNGELLDTETFTVPVVGGTTPHVVVNVMAPTRSDHEIPPAYFRRPDHG